MQQKPLHDFWIPEFNFKVELVVLENIERQMYTVEIPSLNYYWQIINYEAFTCLPGDIPHTTVYNSFMENMLKIVGLSTVQKGVVPRRIDIDRVFPVWDNSEKHWLTLNKNNETIIVKKESNEPTTNISKDEG